MINAINQAKAQTLRAQVESAIEQVRQADNSPQDTLAAPGEVYVPFLDLKGAGMSECHLRFDTRFENEAQSFETIGQTSLSMHREPDPLHECTDTIVYQRETLQDGKYRVETAKFEPFSVSYKDSAQEFHFSDLLWKK